MIYELRTYTPHPGRLEALHKRFRDHTIRIFAKHGITSIGYWVQTDPEDGAGDLVYLVSHPSREAADAAWVAFRSDPEWIKVRDESEADGEIVADRQSLFLESTDYSAIR